MCTYVQHAGLLLLTTVLYRYSGVPNLLTNFVLYLQAFYELDCCCRMVDGETLLVPLIIMQSRCLWHRQYRQSANGLDLHINSMNNRSTSKQISGPPT